ncbi:hypothetical protein [Pseudomonas fontis]|uniref:Uncharacterized protein n=1 Tax=Pseudomonas fontis TaxID=2942633 RepID=A0ABT5NZF4_9PSED|nr:hypothetical protein [Pseudomonas fontis]MDD0976770.1 hypothetical protein [Pseudomonas fontis]MDD0993535.1 hypothetical protein [Pseudomonas fontis]
MNAARELASHPSAVNHESLQLLVQWLKRSDAHRVRKTEPRRLLVERYPAGLISDAELEALLAFWHS